MPLSRFEMAAGDLSLSSTQLSEQRHRIKSYLLHPSYDNHTLEHDICLIELKTPFDLSGPYVGKVTISTHDPNPGTNCKVSIQSEEICISRKNSSTDTRNSSV